MPTRVTGFNKFMTSTDFCRVVYCYTSDSFAHGITDRPWTWPTSPARQDAVFIAIQSPNTTPISMTKY